MGAGDQAAIFRLRRLLLLLFRCSGRGVIGELRIFERRVALKRLVFDVFLDANCPSKSRCGTGKRYNN